MSTLSVRCDGYWSEVTGQFELGRGVGGRMGGVDGVLKRSFRQGVGSIMEETPCTGLQLHTNQNISSIEKGEFCST